MAQMTEPPRALRRLSKHYRRPGTRRWRKDRAKVNRIANFYRRSEQAKAFEARERDRAAGKRGNDGKRRLRLLASGDLGRPDRDGDRGHRALQPDLKE